ncbi:fibronectin type III domain-containing protein [Cystobacter fuscus]|uniref:fibronectin type III domain-containing protein n=1 Tax=Cystobacter fuscus TaxID=43 RepID=UPI0012FD75C0|nr:fibronectin type III domain-containing protein [Cystobacter fuscus]
MLGPDGTTWHNLSAFFERDFLEGVDVDESLDSPVAQATVRVQREMNGLSLAPLVTDSRANNLAGAYSPLLDVGRTFRVEVGLAPLGCEPGPGDWLPLFYGRVDDVDAGATVLTFKGRDFAGVLQDVWLRQEHQYGSAAGTPLQTVCQSILNDSHLSAFGLYVPEDLTWDLGPYNQAVEPVADALSKLATARGAECRWKLRPDTGDWGLWLWVPDRSASEPVWEWGPKDYAELGALSTSLADVRTLVEVVYSDASDLDVTGQPKRKTVVREDVAATMRYGYTAPDGTRVPRFMRVAEAAASNIRSQAAAGRLADAALADLSSASLGVSVEVALHPGLELADLARLAPNGVHFVDAQTLAVRQVTHSLSASGGTTRVQLLGKPSLSPRAWLGMEARPGVAPAPTFTGPAAPSGIAVTGAIAGAVLVFTAPDATTGPEADSYELHVGATPGFLLSTASLKAVSSSTRFDLTGLAPGLTYYARVRSRDKKGNVGPASPEVIINPQYLTPKSMLQAVSFGALPPNGDFEAQVDINSPPDAFTLSGGTWGLDAVSSGDSFAGARSVVFPAGRAAATLTAQAFTVRSGEQWVFSCWYKQGTAQQVSGFLRVRFYSDLSTPLPVVNNANLGGTESIYIANFWRRQLLAREVPDGARYVVVSVVKASGYTGSLTVDSLDALRRPAQGSWTSVTYQNRWIPATPPDGRFQDVRYRRDDFGRVELRGVLLAPSPVTSSLAFTLPEGCRPFEAPRLIRTHNQSQLVSIYIETDGRVLVVAPAGSEIPLDGISFETNS